MTGESENYHYCRYRKEISKRRKLSPPQVAAEIEAEVYVNEQVVRNNSVYVPVSAIFLFKRISSYLLFVVVCFF